MADERQKPKRLPCGAIVPGCTFVATGATEEELMQHVAAHAAEAHGVTDISPELAAKVKASIETQ